MSLDWAYVEDWCRRLTGSFEDVYVFTVPLYLPRQEADGKWRVVSQYNNPKARSVWNFKLGRPMKLLAPRPMCQCRPISQKWFWQVNHPPLQTPTFWSYQLALLFYPMLSFVTIHLSKISSCRVINHFMAKKRNWSIVFSGCCWTGCWALLVSGSCKNRLQTYLPDHKMWRDRS